MIPPFQTVFSVPLTCDSCIKDVSDSLYRLDGLAFSTTHSNHATKKFIGVNNVDADLAKQVISVEGTVSPSSIVEAIKSTGRDAILRGTGGADCKSSSAVALI